LAGGRHTQIAADLLRGSSRLVGANADESSYRQAPDKSRRSKAARFAACPELRDRTASGPETRPSQVAQAATRPIGEDPWMIVPTNRSKPMCARHFRHQHNGDRKKVTD